ncbi:MAG TPA: transglycosylase SLT domain-containing protein [Polyangiaceae bacterium]|nr:transglycosylase SLT domain-containing protein [Polyangiaceae bacterium]
MRVRSAFSFVLIAVAACSRPPASGSGRTDAASAREHAPEQKKHPPLPFVREAEALPLEAKGTLPWVELFRMERWHEAARALDGEHPNVLSRPEVRYARAAAAERLGDSRRVVELLKNLESQLPLLADSIREKRARAAVEAGNPNETLAYFGDKRDPESQLLAARAEAALGDRRKASTRLQSMLRTLSRRASLCNLEAPARALLATVLEPDDTEGARRELRWLAVRAATCKAAEGALERLEALKAPALTRAERLERAEAFADAGLIDRTETEVEAVIRTAGPALEPGRINYLKGRARYVAREDLEKGAQLLKAAAKANPKRAPEWLFYAGRSEARRGELERAGTIFERLQRAYPRHTFAEYAAYQVAQLHYERGRFGKAAAAFDKYLARYGARGRFTPEAKDERAVSWLASGRASAAARGFEELLRSARTQRDRARYEQLLAVAIYESGKKQEGISRLRKVVEDHPLSFAALAAAARLRALGHEPPPPLPSAPDADADPDLVPIDPELPETVRILHRIGLDSEAEEALFSLERVLAEAHPGRAEEALCRAYKRFAPAYREYRVGQRAAKGNDLAVAPVPGRDWIWGCMYPRPYPTLISQCAVENGVEPELVYAVIRQESAFRPAVVSPALAVGLMQILPSTGERLAREINVPFDPDRLIEPDFNVRLGSRYLRKLLDYFGNNPALAAASYNAGPAAVLRWVQGAPELEIDLFVARIPFSETRGYVERVIGNYARYKYLSGGEAAVPELPLKLEKPAIAEPSELY